MKVTKFTLSALAWRRQRRDLLKEGYEFLGEGGGKIWQLNRGARWDHQIVDAIISECGKGVYVKCEPVQPTGTIHA